MLLGTAENLAAIGFTLAEDGGDLGVFVNKDLAKQKDGALDRREALQHHEKRHRKRFVDAHHLERIASGTCDDGFGQPLADVFLAPGAGGLQMVDGQAADDGDQECTRRANLCVVSLLPTDEGLLQHVFRIGYAAQHAVCNGEEQAAILVECRQTNLHFRVGKLLFGHRIAPILARQHRLREYPPQTSSTLRRPSFGLPPKTDSNFLDRLAISFVTPSRLTPAIPWPPRTDGQFRCD